MNDDVLKFHKHSALDKLRDSLERKSSRHLKQRIIIDVGKTQNQLSGKFRGVLRDLLFCFSINLYVTVLDIVFRFHWWKQEESLFYIRKISTQAFVENSLRLYFSANFSFYFSFVFLSLRCKYFFLRIKVSLKFFRLK